MPLIRLYQCHPSEIPVRFTVVSSSFIACFIGNGGWRRFLANGKHLPKWTPKSHLGMYMGSSPSYSEMVARILSLETGYISAQYHVVYNEVFSSVQGTLTEELFDHAQWYKLLRLGYSCNVDVDHNEGRPIPFHDHYEQFMGPDYNSDSDIEADPTAPATPPRLSGH